MTMSNAHTITVTVDGGLIQDIDGIPPGVAVEVRDYDLEGNDTDVLADNDGNEYFRGLWGGEDAEIPSLPSPPGFRCPQCGGTSLTACLPTWFHVWQDPDGTDSVERGNWDDAPIEFDTPMCCRDCEHRADAMAFTTKGGKR